MTPAYEYIFVLGNNVLLFNTNMYKVALWMLTISANERKILLLRVYFSQILHALKCSHPLIYGCMYLINIQAKFKLVPV